MTTLYVSDLDGTLLDRTGELSPTSRRGVLALLDRGVCFTVASARSLTSMRNLLGPLPLPLPVACLNGGTISKLDTGEHLVVHTVAAPLAADIAARAQPFDLMIGAHTQDGERVWVPRDHSAGMAAYLDDRVKRSDPRIRVVDDVTCGLDGRITSLTVIGPRSETEALAADIREAHGPQVDLNVFDDFYTPGWVWMSAHAREATKGHAVRRLRAEHAPDTQRLVVFGDQINDLPMFEIADYRVAPSNAVPEIRDLADEVIGHHHDDAVVTWLLGNT